MEIEFLQNFFFTIIEYWDFSFVRNAFWAGITASIPCGIIGCLLVINKLVFAGEGIAHSAFGGIGLAVFLGISPLYGAFGFTIACSLMIGFLYLRHKEQSDALIGAVMSISMAMGILFMNLTPGYQTQPLHYLFGNVLTVSSDDITNLIIFSFIVFIILLRFSKQIVLVSFDADFAFLRKISPDRYIMFLMLFTGLAVLFCLRITGLILFMALISIPPFIMEKYSKSLWQMCTGSVVLIALINSAGLVISLFMNVPSGPCITLVAGFIFVFDYCIYRMRKRLLYKLTGGLK